MSRLEFKSTLDSRQYERGINNIQGRNRGLEGGLGRLRGMIGRAFAVGAVIAFARAVGRAVGRLVGMGSEMNDLARRTGLTIESFQRWTQLIEDAGGSQQNLVTGMDRLRDAQGQVLRGNETMTRSFADLGISVDEISRLNPEQLFRRVSEALAESGSSARAMSAASDLLGRRNLPALREAMLDIAEGADGVSGRMREIEAVNAAALDAMANGWRRFWQGVRQGAANALGEVARGFSQLFTGRDFGAEALERAAKREAAEAEARLADAEMLKEKELETVREVAAARRAERQKEAVELEQIAERAAERFSLAVRGDQFRQIGGVLGSVESPELAAARQQVQIQRSIAEYTRRTAENTAGGIGLA